MVAAAKLSKTQQKLLHTRRYTERLLTTLNHVVASAHQSEVQCYFAPRPVKTWLFVVVTSDRGLCGAFNTSILKQALSCIQELVRVETPEQVTIVPVGKKALAFFRQRAYRLISDYEDLIHHLSFEYVRPVATWLTEAFLQHRYDRVLLVYNTCQSAAVQTPTVEQWLPVAASKMASSNQVHPIEYIHEPSCADVLRTLIPHLLQMQLYKALCESYTAEQGARMTTMSKATDNAEELLKEIKLTYNRTRQAIITQEIAEIVSGAGEPI